MLPPPSALLVLGDGAVGDGLAGTSAEDVPVGAKVSSGPEGDGCSGGAAPCPGETGYAVGAGVAGGFLWALAFTAEGVAVTVLVTVRGGGGWLTVVPTPLHPRQATMANDPNCAAASAPSRLWL